MISYFKYTSGESFTLSGVDYKGLFNITDDNRAFTGKSLTSRSQPLSTKGTFIANSFLAKKEFDRTFQQVQADRVLTKPHISPKDIIDQAFLNKNLDILNDNNLNLYDLNILSNPEIVNFQSTSEDAASYVLALTSMEESKRRNANLAKSNSFPFNALPFSSIYDLPDAMGGAGAFQGTVPPQLVGIDALDDAISTTLIVNKNQTFNYFITTGTVTNAYSGSFLRDSLFTLRGDETDTIAADSTLVYDNNDDTLYNLGKWTDPNDDLVYYRLIGYDFSFYNTCGNWKIKDIYTFRSINARTLELQPKEVINGNFKIGNNLKGALIVVTGTEADSLGIELTNKYSNKFFGTITTLNPREVILDFDIRDTDDSILVITKPERSNGSTFNVYHVDPDLVEDYKLGLNQLPRRVNRYQSRALSTAQVAQISDSGVPVANTERPWVGGPIDTSLTHRITFSKDDSNMFILRDLNSATTRFISNPEFPAGFFSSGNLQFLPNSYFGFILETFGDSRLAWNTNNLPSNRPSFISFAMEESNGNVFSLYQNTGRLYLTTTNKLIYDNVLPLDLANTYDRELGCESSLGISLNSEIESILKDTLKIYVNLALVTTGTTLEGVPILGRYTSYPNIDVDFRDFEFHENEEINYNVVSRVFDSLYNLQRNVLDSILRN
jgi:hypothetical protein